MTNIILIMKKVELLAPAGSIEKMKYAFAYGADAVYLGVPAFSMRARVNNFTMGDLHEAIDFAHSKKKKVYVTVNIVAHNFHLVDAPKHLKLLNIYRPDALIISDPGIMELAKKYAPDCDIHVSTQANATNWATVKFWKEQGASRVILGREVSIKEMKEIGKKAKGVEFETFVHGAMCMSYSGRCLLSSWLVGRCANLGDCVQPCRWKYDPKQVEVKIINAEFEEPLRPGMKIPIEEDMNGTYIMNSKDMCLIEYLPEILDTGVASIKVEGRTKSVAYVATVMKAYRQALDLIEVEKDSKVLKRKLKAIKKNILEKLVHRGYTAGFAFGRSEVEQNVVNSHIGGGDQFVGEVLGSEKISASKFKVSVRVHNALRVGDKVRIMQPKGKDIKLTIKTMYNEEGEQVDSAHGGTGKMTYIEMSKPVQDLGILLKQNS